jgi:hypothetical protein
LSAASYNKLEQMSSVTPTGGSAITMAYQGLGQKLRVTNGSIAQVNDQLGLEKDATATATWFTRDASGTILGERRGTASYYFLFDGLGSVTAVLDSSGSTTPVNSYSYDPRMARPPPPARCTSQSSSTTATTTPPTPASSCISTASATTTQSSAAGPRSTRSTTHSTYTAGTATTTPATTPLT